MALATNSYGTTAGVAALTPRYAQNGDFTTETRPTLDEVENIQDQVSAVLNMILASNGVTVPVTQADVVRVCAFFVQEEVAAIVEGINGSGRFGAGNKRGGNRHQMILEDVKGFVGDTLLGMYNLGAGQTASFRVVTRGTDGSGDDVEPLFKREQFGETYENWGDE